MHVRTAHEPPECDAAPHTMSTNVDDEPRTHDSVDHAAVDATRYSSVAVDHEETIIYDQQVEDAWIQSNAIEPLEVWQ